MTEHQFHTVWLFLHDRVWRLAFYIMEDEPDAKDAVKDLYLKLWELRDGLELIQNPSAYGSLMLRNLCIDRLRRRKPSAELNEPMALGEPPDLALERREDLQTLQAAIEKLPPTQRKLIGLRVLRGLSYKEIEKETGLSGLNIRVQVSLARKRLKALL